MKRIAAQIFVLFSLSFHAPGQDSVTSRKELMGITITAPKASPQMPADKVNYWSGRMSGKEIENKRIESMEWKQ